LICNKPAVILDLLCQGKINPTWLHAQGLSAMTWHILRDVPNLPAHHTKELHAWYYSAVAHAKLYQDELKRVLEALAAQNITPVLFKGAVLAHTVYPHPACRPMGDMDLWVTADEIDHAQIILTQLGYSPIAKTARPRALVQQYRGEIQMVRQEAGKSLVELHWGIFAGEWLRRTANIDETAIRARAIPCALINQRVLSLSPEDSIIQLAVHLAVNHQMAQPWLRGLLDIGLLAQTNSIDWNVVIKRAQDWRISTATWAALQLALELAGLTEATSAAMQLSPSPLRRHLLNRLTNAESLVRMYDMRHGLLRFVYLLLLADHTRDAVRLFGRTLWPEPSWLEARYGHAGLAMQLRHMTNAVQGKL